MSQPYDNTTDSQSNTLTPCFLVSISVSLRGGKKGGKKARAGKGKGGKEPTQSPSHDQQSVQEEGFEGPPVTVRGGGWVWN